MKIIENAEASFYEKNFYGNIFYFLCPITPLKVQ